MLQRVARATTSESDAARVMVRTTSWLSVEIADYQDVRPIPVDFHGKQSLLSSRPFRLAECRTQGVLWRHLDLLPSRQQRILHNRVHWAKFYVGKAGLIDNPARGGFLASDDGKALLATNPTRIDLQTLKRYPSFVAFYTASREATTADEVPAAEAAASGTATPEEQIDAAHAVLHTALKADLLQRNLAQTLAFFENVIVDLLVAMGYGGCHENAALRLGRSGDGGIDGVIDEDRLGLDRIYVQAKRYAAQASVRRPEVQGFVGSLVGLGASGNDLAAGTYRRDATHGIAGGVGQRSSSPCTRG